MNKFNREGEIQIVLRRQFEKLIVRLWLLCLFWLDDVGIFCFETECYNGLVLCGSDRQNLANVSNYELFGRLKSRRVVHCEPSWCDKLDKVTSFSNDSASRQDLPSRWLLHIVNQ